MDGYQYEHAVASYLSGHGYTGVKVTRASGDFGVDVIAYKGRKKYAVQCKYYSSPVGVSAVQEAVAGKAMYGCSATMVVTNNTFTTAARTLAKANDVVLLEKVAGSRTRKARPEWSIFLWIVYLFILAAIIWASWEATIATPTFSNIAGFGFILILFTLPIWGRPVFRAIKGLFVKKALQEDNSRSSAPQKLPLTAHIDSVKRIFMENDCVLSEEQLNQLITEKIMVGRTQRICKIGFNHAVRIIDALLLYGLIEETQPSVYIWVK